MSGGGGVCGVARERDVPRVGPVPHVSVVVHALFRKRHMVHGDHLDRCSSSFKLISYGSISYNIPIQI